MRKIFLILGLAGFTSVYGQQKEVPDINKYLEKKLGRKSVNNQTPTLVYKASPYQLLLKQVLPNGDKVLASPIYNMPVIKPGNNFIYNMPTGFIPGYKDSLLTRPDQIPNPAIKKLAIIR